MRILLLAAFLGAAFAQPPVTRILVAYHSETGNTEKLARAVREGAASVAGVEASLRKTAEVKPEEILKADGVALGTPVYWASLSAEAKRFLDEMGNALGRNSKTLGEGKAGGVFCTGGNAAAGKDTARLVALAAFLHMRMVVVGGVDGGGYGTLGPEATTAPPDAGISDRELAEARRFGERFARITQRLRAPAAR